MTLGGTISMLGRWLAAAALLTAVSAHAQTPPNPSGQRAPFPSPGQLHAGFKPGLPTLWIVGDSTARNGRDTGNEGGRWGWGHEIDRYFDLDRINVENQALGGTSSRDFITKGHWQRVLDHVRPGDYVLIQFGANDSGGRIDDGRARTSLPGNGDQVTTVKLPDGRSEAVRTYGANLRRFIADTEAKRATPVVLSLIPRDDWRGGKIVPAQDDTYVLWARQAALRGGTWFIDVNHIVAAGLNRMGEPLVKGTLYRADDHTHTTLLGAQFNASCIVAGIKALAPAGLRLADALSISAQPVAAAGSHYVGAPAGERPGITVPNY